MGEQRGMFYLAKILVYRGGSEGYHIVSFSPSCLLLLVCSYSRGIHSVPISFHSLHRSQKPTKVKPTPTNPTQHLSVSSLFSAITPMFGLVLGRENVSSSRLYFLFQFCWHLLSASVVPYLPADTSKSLHLFNELGIRTFTRTHGPRKSSREG